MEFRLMLRIILIIIQNAIVLCFICVSLFPFQVFGVELHPNSGVSMIWYGAQSNLNTRDGIVANGQIIFMWRNFEPTEGKYNFEALDKQLAEVSAKKMKATVQINGNYHPDYIFTIVPYLNAKAYDGQLDHTIGYGPPMYWHPVYKQKFENLIRALAEHIKLSPYKSSILGIRHAPNAIGTEHYSIKSEDRTQSNWTLPAGATWGNQWPWTKEIGNNYRTWTVDMFIEYFNPIIDIPLFMRISALSENYASEKHKQMASNGQLMLFETSSEPQPRLGKELQYQAYVDYCKSGKTWGFTESWSMAVTTDDGWGWTKTSKPISLAQFNYWAILLDLHCGSSFIARRPQDVDEPNFKTDYTFAAKYAGHNHNPAKAPGAWIAFREGDFLVGDYTFLMSRQNDNTIPLYNVDESRYGLWARKIMAGDSIKLRLQNVFSISLVENKEVLIRVRYKDSGLGTFTFLAFGRKFIVEKSNSDEWKLAEFRVEVVENNPDIQITTTNEPLVLHLVEVIKIENSTSVNYPKENQISKSVLITSKGIQFLEQLDNSVLVQIVTLIGKKVFSKTIEAGFSGMYPFPLLHPNVYVVSLKSKSITQSKIIKQINQL